MESSYQLRIQDKYFVPFLSESEVLEQVQKLGEQIANDYSGKKPLLLCILNGSFIFAADLVRSMDIECQISFLKVSSYEKDRSTNKVKELIGINEEIEGRDVIIVEDIIDSGNTMYHLLEDISSKGAKSIRIATCLFKPTALQKPLEPDYVAFSIPEKFVIGYGLDYDNYGRHLKGIYVCQD